ncbi:DUF1559 domain-containing protein [Gimesia chilikensis]|nr:DUF1559 domain-containing protein [Gimesia chilikensis]
MQHLFHFIDSRLWQLAVIQSAVFLACILPCSFSCSAEEDKTAKPEPFRLDLVPEEALGVFALRPAQLLAEPAFKPVLELTVKEQQKDPHYGLLGISPIDLKTVTMIHFLQKPEKTGQGLYSIVYLIEVTNPQVRTKIQKTIEETELVNSTYRGKTFLTTASNQGSSVMFLNENALLFSDKAGTLKKIIDQIQDRKDHAWKERLQPMLSNSVIGGINLQLLRETLGVPFTQSLTQQIPLWPMIAPVWQNTEIATLGITVQKDLSLELIFEQKNDSEQTKQCLKGLLVMGQNILSQMKTAMKQSDRPWQPEEEAQFNHFEQFLKSSQVKQTANRVTFSSSISGDLVSEMVVRSNPELQEARVAARRSVAKNNIKQIMLALHNYHERHHHFPPAVVLGPDGKTPHSWRVELLPYLDQQALYDKYRLNEPWDSEHNLKIAETVVPVFSHPNSSKPANSGYFVVVGEGTAFGNKQGVSFKEITDGTANTIAVVEAKRDIPWTKPEDISYDGKKLPQFGGFSENPPVNGQPAIGVYYVGSCDGRARMIMDNMDEELLKSLLTIADGKPDHSQ